MLHGEVRVCVCVAWRQWLLIPHTCLFVLPCKVHRVSARMQLATPPGLRTHAPHPTPTRAPGQAAQHEVDSCGLIGVGVADHRALSHDFGLIQPSTHVYKPHVCAQVNHAKSADQGMEGQRVARRSSALVWSLTPPLALHAGWAAGWGEGRDCGFPLCNRTQLFTNKPACICEAAMTGPSLAACSPT
jgi:hypothetical protein